MDPVRSTLVVLALPVLLASGSAAQTRDDLVRPVAFSEVDVRGGFWGPRLETNRTVTVRYDFAKCEETGRIDNFAKAGGLMEGPFRGIRFDDSDVFKVVEGAAATLATHPDPELDRYLDELIAKFAAAQEDDGYLFTCRTIDPENLPGATGETRWSYLAHSHELYNVGHMYEAAVAHHQATGKRTLLDVALKNADLIDRVFGPEGLRDVPGHQEIEIGLVRLYRVTGEKRYLDLARFFLDERGRANGRELYGAYCQDHVPVAEQRAAVGHAVRAGYLYCAMADVAAVTGETTYLEALDRIWQDVVSAKTYVTGSVGSSRGGEAFGAAYELPNATAYNETCAAIANALWNHRMFLLHGDAKYLDVLERVLYNGFLAGVSLQGDRFFYPNPLACDGTTRFNQGTLGRSPWFSCSCCPVNVVRFVPALPGFVHAVRGRSLYVNLYLAAVAELNLDGTRVRLTQETRYPWSGRVRLTVDPQAPADFAVRLRIPGWARGQPTPSDLYRYLDPESGDQQAAGDGSMMRGNGRRVASMRWGSLSVNGDPFAPPLEQGFAVLERRWQSGDVIELDLRMPVRRVLAHEKAAEDIGRVALERGPVVYCLEAVDHDGRVSDLFLPDDAAITMAHRPDLLGGVTVLEGRGQRARREADGTVVGEPATLRAVPYHVWAHREVGEMAVWIPREKDLSRPAPLPTPASRSRASASHVWHADTVAALNDQLEPESSDDHGVPRLTWWDHRGTKEWVQYDFAEPLTVSRVEVYWFDDSGRGGCRVPVAWRILSRIGEDWQPVGLRSPLTVSRDAFDVVELEPVTTTALRLEVELQQGFSAGILEWKVGD